MKRDAYSLRDLNMLDLETMGLQTAFGKKRPLGITEATVMKYGSGRAKRMFTNILQSDVEKALQGNVTPEALLQTAMSESRLLHFTRGVMIPGDVEQQILLQYIEGIAKGKNIVAQKELLDLVSRKLEKGERWGSWNVGFDFGTLADTAERTGNVKFSKLYHKALDEGRIVDLAEGVHKYMYETAMEDFPGFEVLHRATHEEAPRTLEDVLLAQKDPDKVVKKWLTPHRGVARLKDNLRQLADGVEYDLSSYDEFKTWCDVVASDRKHLAYLPFRAGEEIPDMRYARDWSTEVLKRTFSSRITEKKFADRIAGRLGISKEMLKHHDSRFDLALEGILVDVFDKWDPKNPKQFETALAGWGFKNRSDFHQEWRKQGNFVLAQLEKKDYTIRHSHLATKLPRGADRAHSVANVKNMLETHTMEGLGISREQKAYDTSFLKKGFKQGFMDAGQEAWTTAKKWSKIHPKASMLLGIGAGLFLLDTLIPSKAKKATPPYEDIEGRRYAYSMWQQINGISPSLIGPPTDFGSARSWFSQLSHSTQIFHKGVSIPGMGETEMMLLKHGTAYANQEQAFAKMHQLKTRIGWFTKPPTNLSPYVQMEHVAARAPLDDMVAELAGEAFNKKVVHTDGWNLHAVATAPGKNTPLKDAIHTAIPPQHPRSPFAKQYQEFTRQHNILDDWGMEMPHGARTWDLVEHRSQLGRALATDTKDYVDVTKLSEAVIPPFPDRSFVINAMPQVASQSDGYVSSRLMSRAGDKATVMSQPFMGGYGGKEVQFPFHQFGKQSGRGSLHMHRDHMVLGMQREGLVGAVEDFSPFDLPSKAINAERATLNVESPFLEGIRPAHSRHIAIQGMNPQVVGDFVGGRIQPFFDFGATSNPFDFWDEYQMSGVRQLKLGLTSRHKIKPDLSSLLSGDKPMLGRDFDRRMYKQYLKLLQSEYGFSQGYAKHIVEHHLGMTLEPVNKVPKVDYKGFLRGTVGGLLKGGVNVVTTPFRRGFWGPAVKTAWTELKAYPRYAADIWRSGASLSKRTFWLSEAFMGFSSEKSPAAMRIAVKHGHLRGPIPPKKFLWSATLQEGKDWLSYKAEGWANRISGGDKANRGLRGFVGRRVSTLGKFAKYARGQTVLNMAMLGMSTIRSSEYNSKVGGMLSETAAFTGGMAAFSMANVAVASGVRAGLVSALGTAALPPWARAAAWVAGFILGEKAYTGVDEFIRSIGHGIFGTATPMTNPKAAEQMVRPDYWNAHIAYKNNDGYSAFGGINVSGKNLTPFRSSYNAEAEPALIQPRMRKRVRRTRFPRTSGLVQVLWATRSGSKTSAQYARSSPIPTVRPKPKPRFDRGVAA